MKCMKRVMSSLVALVMITNIAFGYTVTVSNGIYSIERTGMIDGKTVTVKANKTAGAEFEVKKGNITLNQAIPGMPLADFTMPAEDVEIGIVTTPVNKPILGEGMVPVNWDKDAEDWVDTTEASWEWDYGNVASQESNGELDGYRVGKWANARTADGSMYVWIPRFSYKIVSGEHQTVKSWNSDLIDGTEGTVGKIEIKFSQGALDDLSNGFINHPAFQFNGNEMSGFWVAKFEASRDDATEASEGVGTVPMSVPGVKSWTGASVGEAFTAAYELNQALGSHLIKNSEWGAVVFLTNAIGRTPYKNNHSEMLTGYSGAEQNAAVSGTASYWNEGTGVKASTTHNVYGVYDLAGAASEMTASYIVGSLTFEEVGSSVTAADDTYVDRYIGTTTGTAAEHFEALADIIGDAMYETSAGGNGSDSAWDNGKSQMINESAPVLTRGSALDDTASIFAFEGVAGAQDDVGFRVILLPAEAAATTGPNAPVLADGMIPLNWDGDNWVDTTEAEWEYNYDSVASVASNGSILGDGAGKWANARLADGSIYVWIPRYSYKISSGENKNVISWNSDAIAGDETEVGRVKIRWSSGIHDFNSDGYIPHPAFNYAQYLGGDTSNPNNYNTSTTGGITPLTDADKLEGFWVAKYEASRSDSIIAGEQRLLKVNTSTGITTYRYETSGDMIEVTAAPMDGYEFVGWSVSGTTVSDESQATITFMMPNTDVTLTANFRKTAAADVTVSFNSNGGSAISVKVVSVGNAYGELSIPAKAGYTFGGWYKEEALTNKVTSSTIVTTETDHTLYAKWGESTYTVSFDTDGGSAVANKTVTYNGTYGTLATPVKDGYIFDGWYKEAEFTNPVTSTTTVTATVDHTLYAKWLTAYTVTFNSNGGSAVDSIKVAYGKTYGTLPTPTKENYTFLGWYKEETFINQVTDTSTVTVESDHTLYAKWQINSVTVTLDNQGATTAGTASVTATYGSAMPNITIPTKTGYTFGGYYTEANGGGTQYYNTDGSSAKNWDKTVATTLYAKWTVNTYTITATAGSNGSISPSGSTSVTYGTNKTFTITANSGYIINDVVVDGDSVGTVSSYTFNKIGAEHTISASFIVKPGEKSFAYTGGIQTYTIPATGVYKLETWGAGGSNFNSWIGGAGGYSMGYALLEKGTNLYVCVGGSVRSPSGNYSDGGYNGGGAAKVYYGTPGGGATHIAKVTGTLQEIGEAKKSKILIVAGGGGGAAGGDGGNGGGTTGGSTDGATGGTQSSGGTSTYYSQASFGKGKDATKDYGVNGGDTGNGGGGGGGLFGGGAGGSYAGNAMPGAGGSGYIGGVPSFTYNGTTYSPSTTAGGGSASRTNGSAKITFMVAAESSLNTTDVVEFDYTGGVQNYVVPKTGIYKLEVWGAGGTSVGNNGFGGKSGYSIGYALLEANSTIYVCVGGASTNGVAGGYNGGGSVKSGYSARAGGGATHMATVNGTLANIGEAQINKILIVAGGGGGAGSQNESGGAGGGANGTGTNGATGGSQTAGGSSTHYSAAGFGQGRNADSTYSLNGGNSSCGGGGGGGLYGGGAGGGSAGNAMGGAGGSGYIGGVPSFTSNGTTYSPSTTVGGGFSSNTNGYASITFISAN